MANEVTAIAKTDLHFSATQFEVRYGDWIYKFMVQSFDVSVPMGMRDDLPEIRIAMTGYPDRRVDA